MKHVKLSDDIYYLGVNDRRTHLFENAWPLPNGVAYNSYLIVDEKVALVDTVEYGFTEDFLQRIDDILGDTKNRLSDCKPYGTRSQWSHSTNY
jgi:flavorubredoxin